MEYNTSDKLAIALACLAGVMAIILFLIEKTPATVLFLLLSMFALCVYPILHFAKRVVWRGLAFVGFGIGTLLFGWYVWPHNHPIASSAHTENTPVQRLESKPAETKAETKLESKPSPTRDANRIAQKALYEGHRPWVGLDGGIQFPEPLTFEIYPTTRNMRLGVSYFIKNYGSAPALRAASFAETFVEKGPLKRPEMPMRMACLNADGPKDSPGSTVIFPGQSIRASSYITTNFDPTMHTIGQIWITICTSYTDDAGKLRHTKTWAITVPPKGDQPIPVKPGDQLLYYPRFEAQVYYEATDP